jgi:exodeoxyribonuclease VII large subunit
MPKRSPRLADPRTLTVGELCQAIQLAVQVTLPGDVWVRGEIHDLKRPASGHVYFDLVDPGELGRAMPAKIAVALFAKHRFTVNAILRKAGGAVRMTDGVEVRLRGALEFHPPTGQLKLVMNLIDPAYTLGKMAADRDRLLRTMAAEGLLGRNGALGLSPAPLRVALVTSSGSAAAHDFLDELDRSGFAFQVALFDARVQGQGAAASVATALRSAGYHAVDVVALVRGGGARTDLAVFDSESIVRTIARLDVPVWTGIGHEIDSSLADEVAHTAFKTPTACAAALVERVSSYLAAAEDRWAAIEALAMGLVAKAESDIDATARRLGRDVEAGLRLAEAHLRAAARRTAREAALVLGHADAALAGRIALCAALDPARALARGWSITRDEHGRVVTDPAAMTNGDALVTTLAGGRLRSTVTDRD